MSSSLSSNSYFNKLQVNRLKAQEIKSDNILPQSISWLFSAVFTTATFNRDSTGGVLVFNKSDVSSVIQFSDRPFRKTMDITTSEFVSYFTLKGSNSFEKDPPNVVLNHNEEQRTYTMSLASEDSDKVSFNLVLLPGESHNLSTVSGLMNLFVDNISFWAKVLKFFGFSGFDHISNHPPTTSDKVVWNLAHTFYLWKGVLYKKDNSNIIGNAAAKVANPFHVYTPPGETR